MKIRIKELRERKGLSQNKLAREMEMSLYGVQRYEYGKIHSFPLETLDKFCIILECTPGDIIQFSPSPKQPEKV